MASRLHWHLYAPIDEQFECRNSRRSTDIPMNLSKETPFHCTFTTEALWPRSPVQKGSNLQPNPSVSQSPTSPIPTLEADYRFGGITSLTDILHRVIRVRSDIDKGRRDYSIGFSITGCDAHEHELDKLRLHHGDTVANLEQQHAMELVALG